MAWFITVDGIDGTGKSTQIHRLVTYLNKLGHDVVAVRDPGSTEIGQRLRSILLQSDLQMHRRTEAMLFMASRCEMIESTIRPALDAGKTVVSDRFLLANVVYQSIGDDAVAPELLWELGELANGGIKPDVTILLDLPAEIALTRIGQTRDRMEARGVDYLEAVRQAFLKQLPRSSQTTFVIDADQTIDQVSQCLLGNLAPLWEAAEKEPRG